MTKKIYITILLAALVSACSREEPPSEVVYVKRLNPYHIVKKGETVADISQKYGMSEDELIKINRLKEPYKVVPGQRLVVHVKDESDGNKSPVPVEEGDVAVRPLEDGAATGGDGAGLNPKVPGTDTAKSALEGAADGVTSAVPGAPGGVPATTGSSTTTAVPSGTGYQWPIKGKVVQGFGQKLPDNTISDWVIIKPTGTGEAATTVRAAAGGVVKDAGARIPAYGNMVVIKQSDGNMSIYANLKKILVKAPDKGQVVNVAPGDVIGVAGSPPGSNETQLFFQVRGSNLKPKDPLTLLP
ncbi:MAG: M23 family metallopeptidase [Alphaproteobacteria bacterium]|nr:M23 family metallopeptidase [Alphaproteobacteria bacterium]